MPVEIPTTIQELRNQFGTVEVEGNQVDITAVLSEVQERPVNFTEITATISELYGCKASLSHILEFMLRASLFNPYRRTGEGYLFDQPFHEMPVGFKNIDIQDGIPEGSGSLEITLETDAAQFESKNPGWVRLTLTGLLSELGLILQDS